MSKIIHINAPGHVETTQFTPTIIIRSLIVNLEAQKKYYIFS